MLRRQALFLFFTVLANPASGLVIDNFSAGSLASGPEVAEVSQTQMGLATDSVLGGSRELIVLHGGEFAVGQPDGVLRLDYDRSFFEVAILRYAWSTPAAPLSADFTANGADHLLIRVKQSVYPSTPTELNWGRITLTSGREQTLPITKGASFQFPHSTTPYAIALPFSAFPGLNTTDIDSIDLSFFLNRSKMELEIDEIISGSLIEGDLDADGIVNATDGAAFKQFYGATGPLAADANRDGVVDAADYTVWRDAMAANPAIAIPEPAGAPLALVAIAPVLRRLRL